MPQKRTICFSAQLCLSFLVSGLQKAGPSTLEKPGKVIHTSSSLQRKEMFTCLLPRMLRPGFTQIPLNIMLVYPRLSSPASWVLLLSPSLWDISCVLYNNPSNCSLLSTPILTLTGTMFTSAILHRPLFWALFVSQTEHIFLEEAVCTFYRVSM